MRVLLAPIHIGLLLGLAIADSPAPKTKATIDEPAPLGDISGYYAVEGSENGKLYSGVAMIVRKVDIYFVQWSMGSTFMGVGFRQGDVLSVGWSNDKGRGVNTYLIVKDRLIGRWASMPSNGKVHRETMTFLKSVPKEDTED